MELLLLESQIGEYYVFTTTFAVWAAAPGARRGIDFLRSFRLTEAERWSAMESLRGDAEFYQRIRYQMGTANEEDLARFFDAVVHAKRAEAARMKRDAARFQFLDIYTKLAEPGVLVETVLIGMGCNVAQSHNIILAAEGLEGGYRGSNSIQRKEAMLIDLKTRKDLFVSYLAELHEEGAAVELA